MDPRKPVVHELKTWPEHYAAVVERDPLQKKTVEIRLDDRSFAVGDVLLLLEYEPCGTACNGGHYTGSEYRVVVTHILRGAPWLPAGYVAMSILDDWGAVMEALHKAGKIE